MKKLKMSPGFHHVSIVGFAERALGATREQNKRRFVDWFSRIAEQCEHVVNYEVLLSDPGGEDDSNVYFKVVYTDRDGLAEIRKSPEHQKMLLWFQKVTNGDRMNEDTLYRPEDAAQGTLSS